MFVIKIATSFPVEKNIASDSGTRNDNSDLEEKWMQYANRKVLYFRAYVGRKSLQKNLFNQVESTEVKNLTD